MTRYSIGGEQIFPGRPFETNGRAYPGNWLDVYSPEELDSLGIEVETISDPEPEPVRRLVPKSVIIDRLTDAQVEQAVGLMTQKQRERWRSPDKPRVYFDDPETLAVLQAIGADPSVVMAE